MISRTPVGMSRALGTAIIFQKSIDYTIRNPIMNSAIDCWIFFHSVFFYFEYDSEGTIYLSWFPEEL